MKKKKEELLKELKVLQNYGDPEIAHSEADRLLIHYINDKDIKQEYEEIEKWYS